METGVSQAKPAKGRLGWGQSQAAVDVAATTRQRIAPCRGRVELCGGLGLAGRGGRRFETGVWQEKRNRFCSVVPSSILFVWTLL